MNKIKIKINVIRFIAFLLLVNIVSSCYSQSYLKYIPAYIDIGETSKMIDSLKKKNVNTFLLFLTTISKDQINEHSIGNKDSMEVTYFIWEQSGNMHVTLITDSCIYKEILIPGNSIFDYSHLKNTWLKKDEDIYRFICPINMPNGKDIIIYIDFNSKKFFEIGKNSSYELNSTRHKYRIEFIALLKQTILPTNKNWLKMRDYNRWLDFPEKQ